MIEKLLKLMATIPYDKALHIIYGAVIFDALHFWMIAPYALAAVLVIGILKEIYDKYHPPHTCDWRDALATVIGGVIGYAAGVQFIVF